MLVNFIPSNLSVVLREGAIRRRNVAKRRHRACAHSAYAAAQDWKSAKGLGRVKTPSEGALIWPLLREKRRSFGYVLIAAISGWMPMMFMTGVRL
jgi:hypothetical protein